MLLSRFWYIFLAVAAAGAAGAALLAQGVINRQAIEHSADELRRDRTEFDAVLRLEARARLDRIAFITVDSKLGALLKQAAGVSDAKLLAHINSEAKDVLRGHVARVLEAASGDAKKEAEIRPDISIAVDSAGRIIAQLGPLESNPPGSSLVTYPFIDRALHGYVRDDVIVYDRRVYRVAARPVLSGGEYVGAIAHGYKFDNEFAERVSQGLGGASLVFFYGKNILASATPAGAPVIAEVAAMLPDALADAKFKRGERTDPKPLQSGGRGVYSLLVGSAALSDVGYALARPLQLIASPTDFFQGASKEDVQALPLPILGGSAFILALLGLSFIYFERDRPFRVLRNKLTQLAAGERERLIVTEWRGAYRKLADGINQAIDKAVEKAAEMAPSNKKKANLDEILGPTPVSNVEPYFGFADAPQPKAAPARTEALKSVARPVVQAPVAAAPPAPAPAVKAAPVATAKPVPAPVPAPVPLPKPALSPPTNGTHPANDSSDEAMHFREVYAEYLIMRKECGESTDGLSYEKFESTLNKTRDQVLTKHPAKSVRFTVYVKEGKAALKAAPVKR
jgi:hypothetical protein